MIQKDSDSILINIFFFLIALAGATLFTNGVLFIWAPEYTKEVKTPGYELVITQREEEAFPEMFLGSTITLPESGNKKITIFYPDSENPKITKNIETENKTIKIEREINDNVDEINCDSKMCEIKNGENYSCGKILGWSLQRTERVEYKKEQIRSMDDVIRGIYNAIKDLLGY